MNWNKFKEGVNKPETISQARIFFLFFTWVGFFLGGVQCFINSAYGLGIALVSFSGLQCIAFFLEIKSYKVLKNTVKAFEEMSNNNETGGLI